MRLLNICKKLRYALLPSSKYPLSNSAISSTSYSSISNLIPLNSFIIANFSNLTSLFARNFSISDKHCNRLFSTSLINRNQVSISGINGIIEVIREDGSDMESRLDSIGSNLLRFVPDILNCLNLLKLPALRFYNWLKNKNPNYSVNLDICNLMIANCGLLGDYATMLSLLKEFRNQGICLSENAFSFLTISSCIEFESGKKSVDEVIAVLTNVGGSCCNSGIQSLVERLCFLSCFDVAKYVVEITDRKVSRYCVLVKHLCIRGWFEDARNLIEEMRQLDVEPDARVYNYMISSLCKRGSLEEGFAVFEEMMSRDCSANLITFEILIYFACLYGKSDQAVVLYNQMDSSGVEPRLSTHYAFIRGYFRSQQFDEAYRYVTSIAAVDKCSALDVYTVLARLHLNEGNPLVAHIVLVEMLEKGLKPNHFLFVRALRCLRNIGEENVAGNLKAMYYNIKGVG